MGDHSFLSVESEDFCNMIFNLRKDVSIPLANTLKNDIINTFNDRFKKICHNLQVSKLINDYICFLLEIYYLIFFYYFIEYI